MTNLQANLASVLADTYALYLKTQNYHWHVTGHDFKSLHVLFEEQYTELAQAVDDIAERIRTMGQIAPASFTAFAKLTKIKEGDSTLSATNMVKDLEASHGEVLKRLNDGMQLAHSSHDEGTIVLISERIAHHEKMQWMLRASH